MKSTTALEHQNESSTLHSHGDNVAKAIIVQVVPDEQSPLLQKPSSDSKSLSTSQHRHYQTNSTSNSNKSETKPRAVGLGLIAIAAVIFSYMNVIIKFCGAGFPSFQILLIRSIIQSVCGISSCAYLGVNPFGPRPVRFWLVLRGLAGGSAVAASYYALTHLPFSDASGSFHYFQFYQVVELVCSLRGGGSEKEIDRERVKRENDSSIGRIGQKKRRNKR